jgi:hypothetical protein
MASPGSTSTKKQSPEMRANPFSSILFSWASPLFQLAHERSKGGARREGDTKGAGAAEGALNEDDLWELPDQDKVG